jgi:hypothetical protein
MIKTRLIAYRYATATTSNNRGGGGGGSSSNFLILEVTQKGKTILNPTEDTVKGPIRLRLVSSSSSSLPLPSSQSQSQKGDEQQD